MVVESCAQPSSEDNSRKGLRQSYFEVGHAANCQKSLSSEVVHVVRWGRSVVGDRVVEIRIYKVHVGMSEKWIKGMMRAFSHL